MLKEIVANSVDQSNQNTSVSKEQNPAPAPGPGPYITTFYCFLKRKTVVEETLQETDKLIKQLSTIKR